MVTTSLARARRVTAASLRGGLGAVTGRPVSPGSLHKIVESLGELKGVPMKIGQLLSYVDSSLTEETRAELSALQTSSQAMSVSSVARILHDELGPAARALVDTLAPTPIAAASIGQVHLARLPDGREVAVKVQYPGIARAIENDFGPARLAGGMVSLLYPALGADHFVREARTRILEECDYRAEAQHQTELARKFAEHPVIVIPEVHAAYSTGRVLTTSFVSGLHLDEFLMTGPSQDVRERFGEALFDFYVRSLLRWRVLPGDPHPGNYLFCRDGRLAILDHGCTRTFDAAGDRLARVTLALEVETRDRVYDAISTLGGEALLVLRIRYGLAPVLARLGIRATWRELIVEHGIHLEPPEPADDAWSGVSPRKDPRGAASASSGELRLAIGTGGHREARGEITARAGGSGARDPVAAPPAPAPAPPPAPPTAAPDLTFEVVLVDGGARLIEIVREIRDLCGLAIHEAKAMVDRAPQVVKQTRDRGEAEALKLRLEGSGGTVEIRGG